jgi:hypothetical protein
MALTLQNVALTLPEGTEFPGTPQALMDLIAEYLAISGGSSFNGINYGDVEPEPENRDRPWFKTDGSGNPIGWFGWDGSAWVPIPAILPSGTTAQRPSSPADYTQFWDTDIDTGIIYYGGTWHTIDGSPGDVKFVTGATLAAVLTNNPGWSHYTDGIGRVLAGAAADGSDAQTNVGADDITLTEAQLPPHIHEDLEVTGSEADNGDNGTYTIMASSESIGLKTVANSRTGSTGDGDPVSVVQATRLLFSIIKD